MAAAATTRNGGAERPVPRLRHRLLRASLPTGARCLPMV